MNVGRLGDYIRNQRTTAKLSLRKMSGLAGVSIPYLSQIERGLRKPSAEILQGIAKGLRVSAETLYVQAGILEDRPATDVAATILSDPFITEAHKQTLLQIYTAFREEAGRAEPAPAPAPVRASTRRAAAKSTSTPKKTTTTKRSTSKPRAKRSTAKTSTTAEKRSSLKAGGGAGPTAETSPHPAPTRPSVTNSRKEV
jgi:transcriptional regulator with XRE-family HTH domain